MNYPLKILTRGLVQPFYKENAGFFVFLFAIMFFIVNKVDGAGLYEYHYSLATGMLRSPAFMLLVFFAWILYARRYATFVSNLLASPQYSFLYMYKHLSKGRQLGLFVAIECMLLLPVLLYAMFIVFVGFTQQLFLPVAIVVGALLVLCLVPAFWHVSQLNNKEQKGIFFLQSARSYFNIPASFNWILIRYIFARQKMIWAGIQIFTCGILYLIARNNTVTDYETGTAFLFFNFGILSNGVLIFRLREFEETYISSYRGLPVSLFKRFLQYAGIYVVLCIPVFITAAWLAPVHLHYADVFNFALCAFSLLLFMNSLTFIPRLSMKSFLKILLLVFCFECGIVVSVGFVFLYIIFFGLAVLLHIKSYYAFERNI